MHKLALRVFHTTQWLLHRTAALHCLALPSLNMQPAMWPHLVASCFAGAFALLSYLLRWRPHPQGMPRLALKAAKLVRQGAGVSGNIESRGWVFRG